MTKERIVELWRMGHSREWLVQQQAIEISFLDRVKGLKKPQVKLVAQSDVEEALLEWWREQNV